MESLSVSDRVLNLCLEQININSVSISCSRFQVQVTLNIEKKCVFLANLNVN